MANVVGESQDVITITDSATREREAFTNAADSVLLSDEVFGSLAQIASSEDEIEITDDSLAIKGFVTSASDNINISDEVTTNTEVDTDFDPDFSLNDNIIITEIVKARTGRAITLSEGQGSSYEL